MTLSSAYIELFIRGEKSGGKCPRGKCPDTAAELAAVRKQAKYSDLYIPSSHTFVPIAIESLGPINQSGFDFISEVGRRISAISGDPLENNHLFQRLSICTQQFNAVAFRGAFEDFSGDEAW